MQIKAELSRKKSTVSNLMSSPNGSEGTKESITEDI